LGDHDEFCLFSKQSHTGTRPAEKTYLKNTREKNSPEKGKSYLNEITLCKNRQTVQK